MNMGSRSFAVLASLALLVGCKGKGTDVARHVVAGPAALRDVARLTGTVEPADTIQVKAQVTQQIMRILVKEGDFVKKGQLLYDLDRTKLLLTHEQLVIAVAEAKLVLKSADRNLAQSQTQIQNGSVSANSVQDLEIARDKARLDLQNAQLNLKSNESDLSYTRVAAPQDGQLIRLPVTAGEMAIAANEASGNVLGVIADPSQMKVVVEVSELDYPRLKLGQDVEISTEAQPDKLIQGRVTYIPPAASSSSSNASVMVFKVEVTVDRHAQPIDFAAVAGGARHGSGNPAWNRDSSGMHRGGGADSPGNGSGRWGGKDASAGGHWGGDSTHRGHHAGKVGGKDSLNTALAPGMTVNVDFVFLERKADVTVPYDMVTTSKDGSKKMVRIRDDHGLHPKPVQVGATDYKNYEILSGLSAGDTVYAADDASGGAESKGKGKGPGF
ncbi:MAG TPA: efflux RND transporter periplasmic adaptor subunit [Fibrobacteria bacterium]|nr:efflux RND transporter periplasmic adaptor subunit [Fibrobacteria bacterium]